MSIKSDKWIKDMSLKQDMIVPFEERQVRTKRTAVKPSVPVRYSPANEVWLNEETHEPVDVQYVDEKIISYGLSSYGYDVRAAPEWKIFTNVNSTVIDPKNFDEKSFVTVESDCIIIPPNSFALGRTVEKFKIPRDTLVVCLGKSTYARCGIVVNVTPLEPEWEGYVTLEFSNTTPLPAKLYANEGCAQMLFFQSDEPCAVSYADRGGKYQHQTGVTIPRT